MEFRLNQFAEIYKNRLQTIRIKSSPKPISSELLFNPPIIIVSGYTSSGKTTIAQYLQKTYGFDHIEESDYVKKEIQKYTSLDRFQAIEAINKKYGMTYFIKKTTDSISKNSKNPVVLSGVRRIEEIDYLKNNFPGSLLLFVDGPHELFEKRHLLKCRAEQDINSDYIKLINAEAKWGMESIKEKSNFVINNNCNFYFAIR